MYLSADEGEVVRFLLAELLIGSGLRNESHDLVNFSRSQPLRSRLGASIFKAILQCSLWYSS